MRQRGWLKHGVTTEYALQRHWCMTLFGISIFGTFLATALLVFDSWVNALAVYFASGLMLAALLSQFSVQQANNLQAPDARNPGDTQPGIIFERTTKTWFSHSHSGPHSELTASPSPPNKVVSADRLR